MIRRVFLGHPVIGVGLPVLMRLGGVSAVKLVLDLRVFVSFISMERVIFISMERVIFR